MHSFRIGFLQTTFLVLLLLLTISALPTLGHNHTIGVYIKPLGAAGRGPTGITYLAVAPSIFLPNHPRPIGHLIPAVPEYCPIGLDFLPDTLLWDPCVLQLSWGVASSMAAVSSDQLLISSQLLGQQVPEARFYFSWRAPQMNPRVWSIGFESMQLDADAVILAGRYYSVLNKTNVGPTGDARTFYSLQSSSTLPSDPKAFVPVSVHDVYPPVYSTDDDVINFAWLASDVRILTFRWFFQANDTCAYEAIYRLNTWFVDPRTSMLPTLDWADVQPNGLNSSTDAVLKVMPLLTILDCLSLLKRSNYYSYDFGAGAFGDGMDAWLFNYLNWLTDSALGQEIGMQTDYRGTFYLTHLIAVGAQQGQPLLVREAVDMAFGNLEKSIMREGMVNMPKGMNDAEVDQYQVNTLQAFTLVARQVQSLVNSNYLVQEADEQAASVSSKPTTLATGTQVRLPTLNKITSTTQIKSALPKTANTPKFPTFGSRPSDLPAATAAQGAALYPLPDILQYNLDVSVPKASSLLHAIVQDLVSQNIHFSDWTTAAQNPPGEIPLSGRMHASVYWQIASIKENPWYAFKGTDNIFACPVSIDSTLPYGCLTTLGDLISPLVKQNPIEWITMGAFAPVKVAFQTSVVDQPTIIRGIFPTIVLMDTKSLPIFLSIGMFSVLRWGSFFFRFIPALWFLYRERNRRRYYKSLKYRSERDVTIIVPTIDSGPELKVAIESWLVNRPKRIIFATVHKEKANIMRLLQETCDEHYAKLIAKRKIDQGDAGSQKPFEISSLPSTKVDPEGSENDIELGRLGPDHLHRASSSSMTYPMDLPTKKLVSDEEDMYGPEWRTKIQVVSVAHGNKRQQMVAGLAHVDTPLFVLADDDAVWPKLCLQHIMAVFDNKEIGGCVTQQYMRPIPKGTPGRSWFTIGDATIWEIIADFRLETKTLENAAAVWFGTSLSCLSGRTAAYRTCIIKPTIYEGPCNPRANRFFHVDKFGYRKEDYDAPQELAARLKSRIAKSEVYADSLSATYIRQLIRRTNALESIEPTSATRSESQSSNGKSNSELGIGYTYRGGPLMLQEERCHPKQPFQGGIQLRQVGGRQLEMGKGVGAEKYRSATAAGCYSQTSVGITPSDTPVTSACNTPATSPRARSTVLPTVQSSSNLSALHSEIFTVGSANDYTSSVSPESYTTSSAPPTITESLDDFRICADLDSVLEQIDQQRVTALPEASTVPNLNLPLHFYSFCIEFCNDYFIQPWEASQLHSGDDKFLTRYLITRGWLMYCQTGKECAIESTFKPNWMFLRQYLRWTRNTWRSDFRSLFKERAVWKSPHYWFLVYLMFDKMIAPFTLLIGPIMLINICVHASVGLYATPNDPDHPYRLPLWIVLCSYTVWVCITRAFRIFPHFARKPLHLLAVPFYVLLQYLLAVLKLYCLFTLHVTDWGTRAATSVEDEQMENLKYTSHDQPAASVQRIANLISPNQTGITRLGDFKRN